MAKKTKKQGADGRGGARKGAGRPAVYLDETRLLGITLSVETAEWLQAKADAEGKTKSQVVEVLLRAARRKK